MRTVNRANHDFALAGLGLGIAVLVVVWVFANRGVRARRLMTSDLDIYRSTNELISQTPYPAVGLIQLKGVLIIELQRGVLLLLAQ
jgi:hypothetical protein